ncbi:hypothetical protein CCR75_004342 [Bremia lactucae]|uniref:MYND-type domain-containing protein n=1 Tax=Bremia lactucae TaxID=4779 RepID=A0A976IDN1_BRELC|nr:hypothetical protein CCR75_004342 [Bremia lactucae]
MFPTTDYKMGKPSNIRKRKAGHVGFQAGEIAFIEDEMAALAAEFGLEVDGDVASHVKQRQQSKKTRRRQRPRSTKLALVEPTPSITRSLSINLNAKQDEAKDTADTHSLVVQRLADVLPDTCALRACSVPGCSCVNGSRSCGIKDKDVNETTPRDLLETAQCRKCQHGVLQHAVVLRDDADPAAALPTGGQRLLQCLYQIIRLGRISASIFQSRVWTTFAINRLDAVVRQLKKQRTAGGTHNGQNAATEVREEMHLLAKLQTLLQQAHQTLGAASRQHLPIALACVFDQMYFCTYYTSLVLNGRACDTVPSPETYFIELEQYTPNTAWLLDEFLTNELSHPAIPSRVLTSLALGEGATSEANSLLRIFHARIREGIRLFYEEGVGMDGEMDAVVAAGTRKDLQKSLKKPLKRHYRRERKDRRRKETKQQDMNTTVSTMPSYALLTQWRNNCRDWCCHLFAYATPTHEALNLIQQYAPIVEIGAGTGYWSSLLQRTGVDIVAFDKTPPHSNKTLFNEYHGQVPPFCTVQKGGPEVLSHDSMATKKSLLLCYPPPNDPMALQSLQLFQGDVVLHIGEWQGDTGDSCFENELERCFRLVQEVLLPNWGNSAYSLTVWRRQTQALMPIAWRGMSCFHCGKTRSEVATQGTSLRRCKVCKTNVYCSSSCAQMDVIGHEAEHAMRLVFLQEPSLEIATSSRRFENEAYYSKLKMFELNDQVVTVKHNGNAMIQGHSKELFQSDLMNVDSPVDEETSGTGTSQVMQHAAFTFNFTAEGAD